MKTRPWLLTAPGSILMLAVLTGFLAWWLIALPVFTHASAANHLTHFPQVFVHAVGGTLMLVTGALNLYIGATRKQFRFHKAVGYIYLLGGAVGASSAIVLALSNGHRQPLTAFEVDPIKASDIGWALATLGAAWLLAASMGLRAVRNRRYDSHQQWMIRSYVLVWSFVLCRLIGKIPDFPELGGGGAIIWLSWVVPLLVCELVMQWPAGSQLGKTLERKIP